MDNKKKFFFILFFSFLFLIIVFLFRISVGNKIINPFNLNFENNDWIIVNKLRIPKFFNGFIIGGGLAVSGLVLQIILRNPLAEPFTLGLSSGSAFGAVFIVFLSILKNNLILLRYLPIGAIFGSLIVVFFLIIFILYSKYFNTYTIILAGVIINSFFSSLITLFISLLSNKSHIAISWLMGYIPSFASIPTYLLYLIIIFLYIFVLFFWKELDIFYFPDNFALNLGVNIKEKKLILIVIVSIVTSIIVSQSGIIGFVGFIIPHFVRNILVDSNFKRVSFIAFLWGGILLVFCDVMTQFLPSIFGLNSDIPVGVITALLCSPIFIYLLIKKNEKYIF
jgi:iron complex transport system permease protein